MSGSQSRRCGLHGSWRTACGRTDRTLSIGPRHQRNQPRAAQTRRSTASAGSPRSAPSRRDDGPRASDWGWPGIRALAVVTARRRRRADAPHHPSSRCALLAVQRELCGQRRMRARSLHQTRAWSADSTPAVAISLITPRDPRLAPTRLPGRATRFDLPYGANTSRESAAGAARTWTPPRVRDQAYVRERAFSDMAVLAVSAEIASYRRPPLRALVSRDRALPPCWCRNGRACCVGDD